MKKKKYWEMTTAELAEATKEFDEEMVVDRTLPLTAKERAWWNKVQMNDQKQRINKAPRRITVSIQGDLLDRATDLAKKR